MDYVLFMNKNIFVNVIVTFSVNYKIRTKILPRCGAFYSDRYRIKISEGDLPHIIIKLIGGAAVFVRRELLCRLSVLYEIPVASIIQAFVL